MPAVSQDRQSGNYEPTLRDLIALEIPDQAKLSPNGEFAAFTLRTTNWRDNCYEQQCILLDTSSRQMYVLVRSGDVQQIEWVDERTLALLRTGPEDDAKAQIWLYEGLRNEGWPVTEQGTGVDWFRPFAKGFLYLASHPEREKRRQRSERFGKFSHFEQEESASALYYVGTVAMQRYRSERRALAEDAGDKLTLPVIEVSRLLDRPRAIQMVVSSLTQDTLYITCWPHDDLVYYRDTATFCITLDAEAALAAYLQRQQAESAGNKDATDKDATDKDIDEEDEDTSYLGQIRRLHLPAGASMAAVAPDGDKLLIDHRERDQQMYTREDMWIIERTVAEAATDADAFLAGMKNISANLDRQVMNVKWTEAGIFAVCGDGAAMRLVRLGEDGRAARLEMGGVFPELDFHVNAQGNISFVGTNAKEFYEVYLAIPETENRWNPTRLTHYSDAISDWVVGEVETIRWTSVDGTEIEGVLRKPVNFDPTRRYPLVFVVHGGPDWLSPAYLLYYDDLGYYPSVQFANKDVLVLKPNYRGSKGRGQDFTDLNVNNLGVGDLWDLESAIDYLVELGWVDPERVGCMGWSQGGYISAFAGLHSQKFKAVSVGAGISDWYTYHISNDIPDFTTHYLSGSPFRDRELYDKTAPIRNIAEASTPMLIQHGSDDRRVPLSNAMELYRGLKEVGVPVELFVYPGFGHPITKPRENHAVMYQNLAWFSHYLLDEELALE